MIAQQTSNPDWLPVIGTLLGVAVASLLAMLNAAIIDRRRRRDTETSERRTQLEAVGDAASAMVASAILMTAVLSDLRSSDRSMPTAIGSYWSERATAVKHATWCRDDDLIRMVQVLAHDTYRLALQGDDAQERLTVLHLEAELDAINLRIVQLVNQGPQSRPRRPLRRAASVRRGSTSGA